MGGNGRAAVWVALIALIGCLCAGLTPMWAATAEERQFHVPASDAAYVASAFPESLSGMNASPTTGRLASSELLSAASGPMVVEIGLYVLDLAKIDLKESEFFADFYIWYKWRDASGTAWTPENIEFMNGTVEAATKLATDTLPDGRLYASQRVKGRFRGRFQLQLYPFDAQILPIVIEDTTWATDRLLFAPDANVRDRPETWVEKSVDVPNWRIDGVAAKVDTHVFATDFGSTLTGVADRQSDFSRFTFSVRLQRIFLPYLVKIIIPLLVIAGMSYLVFFINAKEFQAQTGICVTALLSAVALHNSQADALPAVGYLVMADKIFILFYVVIFSALVQTVVVNTLAKRNFIGLASRMDFLFRFIYPIGLIAGSLAIAFFTWLGN